MINGTALWSKEIVGDMIKRKISDKTIDTYPNIPNNLYDILANTTSICPDKIGIVDNYNKEFSYSDILKMVDELSSYLHNIAGVKPRDHVALMLYNSIEFCISFLSICKLGAVTIPLPSKYKMGEIQSLAKKSDLQYIICDEHFYDWFHNFEQRGIKIIQCKSSKLYYGFSHLKIKGLTPVESLGGYEDTAIIMFTSGTTSQSKGVIIKNYNIMHAIVSYQRILGITDRDKTIIPIPIYHVTGLIALLGLFIHCRGTIYIHKVFDSNRVLTCIKENEITFIHASPTVFLLLLQKIDNFPSLPSLKNFACGSSNMPIEKLKKINEWLPSIQFHTIYGLTETSSPATIFPTDASTSKFVGSSGLPIPGTQFKIVDDESKELPSNNVGEVLVRGSVVLSGYYKMTTDALDKEGWLKTGDLGYFNNEGYLYIVDRKKDMINRGGEKIWSYEVENEIYKIPGVEEAAVVGIPDEIYGEVAAAAAVLASRSTLTEESIRNALVSKLAKFKIPKRILIVDEIPKTANTKTDKNAVRNLFK